MNRLVDSSYDGKKESFTYDKVGNRLTKTTNDITEKYVYNVKNQLKEIQGKGTKTIFTLDKQGNTLKEETTQGTNLFEYNTLNQQVKAITKDGNTLVNRYDSEGLRYEIEENEKLSRFIFNKNGDTLVELDQDNEVISRFTRGYEVVAADVDSKRYYYSVDEQGSTIFITDSNEQVKNEYWYDAFGNVLESREDIHNRITYTGQQFDKVTQQYYLRARFYNPVIGRFTQEDEYRGDGLNLYVYCGNNPVIYYDPSGYAFLDDLLYDSEDDIKKRLKQVPGKKPKYGYWDDKRGNSKFYFKNKDKTDFHNRVEKLMKAHNAKYVPYKNGQVDFDYFAVFTVDTNVSSKRSITHPNTNQQIAKIIVDYNGNYEEMFKNNVMGIAEGSQRSQDMAKSIIETIKKESIDKTSNTYFQKILAQATLKEQQKLYGQTIHEENLVKNKKLNKTQWVDTDINHQFGHLGGTSEAKRQENESLSHSKCDGK